MLCSIFELEKKKNLKKTFSFWFHRKEFFVFVEGKVEEVFMVHMYGKYHRDYNPENYIFLEQKLKIQQSEKSISIPLLSFLRGGKIKWESKINISETFTVLKKYATQ